MQVQTVGSHFGVTFAGMTHVGMRRSNNQDSLVADPARTASQWRQQGHLFVVADGMGAHAAGELASKLATDLIVQSYRKHRGSPAEALAEAVQEANRRIHLRGQDDEFRGMGTTVCALVLLPHQAILANVGDSRIYRLRGGVLEQLTFDHSLLWELRAAQSLQLDVEELNYIPRNVITRSLGPHPEVKVDVSQLDDLQPGDVFILCSDGLSGPVKDELLGKIVALFPPEEAAKVLVHLANYLGGPDNISVIIVRVDEVERAGRAGAGIAGRRLWQQLAIGAGILALAAALTAGWAWFFLRALWALPLAAIAVLSGLAGVWFVKKARQQKTPAAPDNRLRSGPYASAPAMADEAVASFFAKAVDDLVDRGSQEGWPIDWTKVKSLREEGGRLQNRGDLTAAARAFGRSFSEIMDQLFSRASGLSYGRSNRDRL